MVMVLSSAIKDPSFFMNIAASSLSNSGPTPMTLDYLNCSGSLLCFMLSSSRGFQSHVLLMSFIIQGKDFYL